MFGNPFFQELEKNKIKIKWMVVAFLLLVLLWVFLYVKALVAGDVEMKFILTSISILSLILIVLSSIYLHELFLMLLYPLAPLVVPMIYLTFTVISDRHLLATILIHIPHVAYVTYCIKKKILCRWELIPLGTIIWLLYIKAISIVIDKHTFIYIFSSETTSTMVLLSGSIMTVAMIILTSYQNKGTQVAIRRD
ncbi:MAG: hypothetical protein MUP22_02350 [Desulfobacterales bacterium]|nr:hypothetical protein [Desulfobacterales bacterium]